MVKCELCGKEFRTTQGLRGHKTFVHHLSGGSSLPAATLATEQQLSELSSRLEQVEGLAEYANEQVEHIPGQMEEFTKKVDELIGQVNEHTSSLVKLAGQCDSNSALAGKVSELEQHLTSTQKQPDLPDRFKAGKLTTEDKKWLDSVLVPDVLEKAREKGVLQLAENVGPGEAEPGFDPTKPYLEFQNEEFPGATYCESRKRWERLIMPKEAS